MHEGAYLGLAAGRGEEYAKQREAFGRKIAAFPVIRDKLVDMYAETEAARLLTYRAAAEFDKGRIDAGFNAMVKMVSGRAAYKVAYEAVQIFGGYGYMKDSSIEHFYRDGSHIGARKSPV